jgi:hypothetical protein
MRSPQGPAHYDMMSRVFNKMSKNDFALSPSAMVHACNDMGLP